MGITGGTSRDRAGPASYGRVGGHAKELEIYPEHSGKYCDIIRFVLGRESRTIVGDRFEEE